MDKENKQQEDAETYDDRLKGTFISVIAIGTFIILSWLGVLYYYITTL